MALARWRTDFRQWEKTPGSPVCEVDLDVDRMLYARLHALLPDAGWLSEETRRTSPTAGGAAGLGGRPHRRHPRLYPGARGLAVSVALVEDGVPVIGVLAAPARGELWLAQAGHGATRNGSALSAGYCHQMPGARVPVDALPKADRDLVAVFKPNSIALRIAMVAADEADLVATLRWGNEWDIAAAR